MPRKLKPVQVTSNQKIRVQTCDRIHSYVREDISCLVHGCRSCKNENPKLTPSEPFFIPDLSVYVHHPYALTCPNSRNVILCSTFMGKLKQISPTVYGTLVNLLSASATTALFPDRNQADTSKIDVGDHGTLMYSIASYYRDHCGASCSIITDNEQQRLKVEELVAADMERLSVYSSGLSNHSNREEKTEKGNIRWCSVAEYCEKVLSINMIDPLDRKSRSMTGYEPHMNADTAISLVQSSRDTISSLGIPLIVSADETDSAEDRGAVESNVYVRGMFKSTGGSGSRGYVHVGIPQAKVMGTDRVIFIDRVFIRSKRSVNRALDADCVTVRVWLEQDATNGEEENDKLKVSGCVVSILSRRVTEIVGNIVPSNNQGGRRRVMFCPFSNRYPWMRVSNLTPIVGSNTNTDNVNDTDAGVDDPRISELLKQRVLVRISSWPEGGGAVIDSSGKPHGLPIPICALVSVLGPSGEIDTENKVLLFDNRIRCFDSNTKEALLSTEWAPKLPWEPDRTEVISLMERNTGSGTRSFNYETPEGNEVLDKTPHDGRTFWYPSKVAQASGTKISKAEKKKISDTAFDHDTRLYNYIFTYHQLDKAIPRAFQRAGFNLGDMELAAKQEEDARDLISTSEIQAAAKVMNLLISQLHMIIDQYIPNTYSHPYNATSRYPLYIYQRSRELHPEQSKAFRIDCTHVPVVSIDPVGCMDIDDSVSCRLIDMKVGMKAYRAALNTLGEMLRDSWGLISEGIAQDETHHILYGKTKAPVIESLPSNIRESLASMMEAPNLNVDFFNDRYNAYQGEPGHHYLTALSVHIADVSSFVLPGSELDNEAMRRLTTVYLPNTRIDMLPSLLSTNICSLWEAPRYTMFSDILVDSSGRVCGQMFGKGLIRNRASMSYQEAQSFLELYDTGSSFLSGDFVSNFTQKHKLVYLDDPVAAAISRSAQASSTSVDIKQNNAAALSTIVLALLLFRDTTTAIRRRYESKGMLSLESVQLKYVFSCPSATNNNETSRNDPTKLPSETQYSKGVGSQEGQMLAELKPYASLPSMELIETAMIAANKAVAKLMAKPKPNMGDTTSNNVLVRVHNAIPVSGLKRVRDISSAIAARVAQKLVYCSDKKIPVLEYMNRHFQRVEEAEGDILEILTPMSFELLNFTSNGALATSVRALQGLSEVVYGLGTDRFSAAVKAMLTRCMTLAKYDSSIECVQRYERSKADSMTGSARETTFVLSPFYHYGLGLSYYSHFTSPIRRYADIITHRQLAQTLCVTNYGGLDRVVSLPSPSSPAALASEAYSDFLEYYSNSITNAGNGQADVPGAPGDANPANPISIAAHLCNAAKERADRCGRACARNYTMILLKQLRDRHPAMLEAGGGVMPPFGFDPSLLDVTKVDLLPGDFIDVTGVINAISISERESVPDSPSTTSDDILSDDTSDSHGRDSETEITLDVSCRQVALDVELQLVGVLVRPPRAPPQAASCEVRAANGGALRLRVFDKVVVRIRCDSESSSPRRWALDLVVTLIGRQTHRGEIQETLSFRRSVGHRGTQ